MGMFDDLRCEVRLPARPDAELRGFGYQTKDLDCELNQYVIRPDGRLVDANIRMEQKRGAPPAPDMLSDEYFDWHRTWFERKEGPDIPSRHTGSVNFYTGWGKGEWIEFCAFVEDGTVTKIKAIELPERFQKRAVTHP